MPADLGSLHRILKDPTRRRILSALNEKGPLAYVELLGLLEIEHTGKLNYHLKLLGDLVSKDESGRYNLTEKGKLAVQVTSKFQRVSSQENQSTLHVGRIGLGKLLLVLSIPLFIISFIPLSQDYWLASDVSVLFGVVTVMFLVFGMVFIFPRSQSNDHLSLLQALGYGVLELSLLVLLLTLPVSGSIGGILLGSRWSAASVYFLILPGLLTWLVMALRQGDHTSGDVLKAAIGATGLLWVGGLVLAGIIAFLLGAAPGFLGVYRLVVGNSLLVTLFLFVGIIAIEGAYRLIGWKGHNIL
jgi:DNA-binding transcriptional ArsR family regulator